MPRRRVRIEGHRAQVAVRNVVLLDMAERGLSSGEIASLPGIALDERTIREGIAQAKRLRDDLRGEVKPRLDPKVVPLFGCQPWERSKEELPRVGADCSHCGRKIARGEPVYCPKCATTGYDYRMARELGEAIRRIPTPRPAAKSRLQGRGPAPATPPKLSPSHRVELARTPQGYLWLQSIGQLPEELSGRPKAAKRKRKDR